MKDKNVNNKITRIDGGKIFSVTVVLYLFFSVMYTFIITAIARSKGVSLSEINSNIIVVFGNCCIASVAVVLAMLYFSRKNNVTLLYMSNLNKFDVKYLLIVVLGTFGLITGLGNLNDYFIEFLSKFGYEPSMFIPPEFSIANLLWCILFVCVIPAFFEELLFRGILYRATENLSEIKYVLLSGVLFSLFHMNPAQTIYQFLVGAYYALICVKTKSTLITFIMHALNNTVVIVSYYFFDSFSNITIFLKLFLTVAGLITLVLTVVWICHNKDKRDNVEESPKNFISGLSTYSVGIIVCLFIWISGLFV